MSKLEEMISKVVGRKMRVACEVKADTDKLNVAKSVQSEAHNQDDTIEEAMAIFS